MKTQTRITIGVATALVLAAGTHFLSLSAPDRRPAQADRCDERHSENGISVSRMALRDGRCTLSVKASDTSEKSRSFTLSEDGLFLVFNSFGSGSDSQDTGARAYFLFPRGGVPRFDFTSEGKLVVTTAQNKRIEFSARQGLAWIESFEGASLNQSKEIRADNAGGVTLTAPDGLLLDCGWSLGESPFSFASRYSTFQDAQGHTCRLKNSLLFKDYPNAKFAFRTDSELSVFLKRTCPELVWGDFAPAETSPEAGADAGEVGSGE